MKSLVAILVSLMLLSVAGSLDSSLKPASKSAVTVVDNHYVSRGTFVDNQQVSMDQSQYQIAMRDDTWYDPHQIDGVILRHQLVESGTFGVHFAYQPVKPVDHYLRC